MHERFNPENPYVATAIQMAEKYNLPRNVFLSLIQQESSFRPDAVSPVGARGLGQLMPDTAAELRVNPYNPTENLEGSARYLRSMLDRNENSLPLALASYNAGLRRVQQAGNTIPNISETQKYVPTVLRNAGIPGYAHGGLAHLEHKYADGDLVVAPGPVHEIVVRATRLPRHRAPRPAPREELTANQLNDMVLDRIAGRAAPATEIGPPAEARERIGRTMAYDDGGLVQPYVSGGGSGTRVGNARIVGYGGTAGLDTQIGGGRLNTSITGQGMSSHAGGHHRQHHRIEGVNLGYTTPSGDRFTLGFHDRLMAAPDTLPGANPMEIERGMSPSRGVRVGFSREFAEGGLADLHQKYARGGEEISDEEYDRRLLSRMKAQTGRTTESTNAEQAQALRNAGYDAAQLASDIFLPQSPLDAALMVAFGPGPRMARLAGSAALAALEPSEAEAGVVRRVGRALGRAGARSTEDALEAAATPVAPTRRRGTIGIIPEETPRAPAVLPSAAREANAATDLQDETLRAYLDRNSTREPTVRTLPEGEDVLGLRNYDLSRVPDVPQVDLPRVVPPKGVSARMSDLVNNEDVWREYSDLVRNGRDNLQGREWYNMEPLRHAFVRELGEDEGTAAFRHYTQNIAATSPRSNIIDNMRNASYYFVQEPSGLILPMRQPAPYGHLAQNLHRQNVETIRSPEGWDLFTNPKPPSFAENLGGNQRPGTMDAHALSVPSILSRDPRFLTTNFRIPSGGDYLNFKPRASYGRGVFTMDEAVRRPQLWDAAPNPNEYGALERRFRRLGEDLDMTTAQAQASGWVGGGRISGLTSPPLPAVDVFQRVVNRTAAQEGRNPQEVLRGFIHRQNALRAAAPVAIGVGANEELDGYAHGGLAQLEHKYAEGGAVSAQPAIYDPDAVNTLANQIEAGYV